MVNECTTEQGSIQAYAFQQSAAQLTVILAPLLGGLLYNPTSAWPWLATYAPILHTYPALLPCIVNACLGVGALTAVILGVEEVRLTTLSIFFFWADSDIKLQTRDLKPKKDSDAKPTTYRSLLAAPGMLAALVIFTWSGSLGEAIAAGKPSRGLI